MAEPGGGLGDLRGFDAGKSVKTPERILFIRTDRIGDVLLNLPAIRLLRQTFPKSWIALILDQSLKGLIDGHPDLDELIFVDASQIKKSPAARRDLCRKIRGASFDLAVISNPDKWMHFLAFWSRIPQRVGYERKWGFFLTRRIPDRKAVSGRHEIESNLELVGLVSDKTWDEKLFFPVHEKAAAKVKALLAQYKIEGKLALIHPGTSDPAKRWDPERFAEVSDHLQKKEGFSTVLIGGPEEAPAAAAVMKHVKIPTVDWTGRLDLSELAAFLSHPQVKLLISSDSGPVHIAWIQGVPVVALYSKGAPGSDPRRWGPRDSKSEVIHKAMPLIFSEEVCGLAEKILARE